MKAHNSLAILDVWMPSACAIIFGLYISSDADCLWAFIFPTWASIYL